MAKKKTPTLTSTDIKKLAKFNPTGSWNDRFVPPDYAKTDQAPPNRRTTGPNANPALPVFGEQQKPSAGNEVAALKRRVKVLELDLLKQEQRIDMLEAKVAHKDSYIHELHAQAKQARIDQMKGELIEDALAERAKDALTLGIEGDLFSVYNKDLKKIGSATLEKAK